MLAAANRRSLAAGGTVVYLNARPEDLYERVHQDRNRPLLATADPLARLRELHAERDPLYREIADLVVDTGAQSAQVLARDLLDRSWRSGGKPPRRARQPRLPDPHRRRPHRARASFTGRYLGGGAAAIVTNEVVGPLYLAEDQAGLGAARATTEIVVPDGEQAKGWATLEKVFDALLAARCGRDTLLVALGGGVVGDLAGFAAAIYQRGMPFVQVPTTLLAQVDSSVGRQDRDQPRARQEHDRRLPPAPRRGLGRVDARHAARARAARGLAEVIKHGLALDLAFVEWLEGNIERLLDRDRDALAYAVQALLRAQGGDRRRGRARDRRAGAAQFRPHLRPRHRGRHGLRQLAARGGDRGRHGDGGRAFLGLEA